MALNSTDCLASIAIHAESGNTLCIHGPSGIGKTSVTEQFVAAQGEPFFYSVLNGATANLADTIGFMVPHKVDYSGPNGEKVTVPHGHFTYPFYFMDRRTHMPAFMFQRGVVVVEEWGQASPDVKRALATLVLEKRQGDHKLPKDFQIILLTNRTQDRSGVGKDFDFVINRRVDIEFKPELDPWVVWASDNGVDPLFIAFAARNPEIVFSGKHPEKQGPWCTPRSLVAASKTWQAMKHRNVDFDDDTSLVVQNLTGSLGGTALQLMAFLKIGHQLPKLESIVKDPTGTHVPDQADAQMILTFELAHKATHENINALATYMKRLPKAFSVTFVKTATKRNQSLISTGAVKSWVIDNQQLLAAISR